MKFNALKSNIRYGPKCTDLNKELHVDSIPIAIPCVNRVKYFGVYLMSGCLPKVSKSIGMNQKIISDRHHHRLE